MRPGFGSGTATAGAHSINSLRVLRVHLGAFDSLDHDRRRVSGPMGPSGGCHEPVIMIGRQQHELPAAVPGDLYGLAQRLVLELAEFPLELHCGRLRHHRLEGEESRDLQNIRIIRTHAKVSPPQMVDRSCIGSQDFLG